MPKHLGEIFVNGNKREFLINYIIKLNDRKIDKKVASGFTLWALLGFLGYILYDLLNNITYILNQSFITVTMFLSLQSKFQK